MCPCRAPARRQRRPHVSGYLLTSLTARARPGSVEVSRWWLANRLPTGVMGVAREWLAVTAAPCEEWLERGLPRSK